MNRNFLGVGIAEVLSSLREIDKWYDLSKNHQERWLHQFLTQMLIRELITKIASW